MTKAVVLGAGIVGAVIAADLADDGWDVTVVDRAEAGLERVRRLAGGNVQTVVRDLSAREALLETVAPFDVVLGALPGFLGYEALRTVIEAGKNCCDISFMPEDARGLDPLARERGVTAVVDCGVAPGLSNLLCGHAVARLDACLSLSIEVGGLPADPQPPFEYKAAFSPIDVIEEYVRPARYVEDGALRTVPALTDLTTSRLPGVPPLESFLTDGLRSLADTLAVPAMKEKTLRYPGHARLMACFREAGLFGTELVDVGGVSVRPIDVTTKVLFPAWTYAEGERDLTVMRVLAEGTLAGEPARLCWDLLDHYDEERGFSSMGRTTAFPCTLVAREIVAGRLPRAGVLVPEELGADSALVDRILTGLADRDVEVQLS